jgi:hypothetical protein
MARPVRKTGTKQVPLGEVKDDWLEYRLENDPRFLKRIANARGSIKAAKGVRLEDVDL